ncbi:Retrovirus-related Pol polyprotein from transposon RE2 [Vitis vinifera]|uniref:Retrovirus-related Pol polyprotein from transposon RE2 n=1 Tax=Vitis vinifera TaxID=29760 RepID=A0A438HSI9_VITVI|nr:Retrovirus-related Pol polyprotein from transposon RE2 [Vitis vinifera]
MYITMDVVFHEDSMYFSSESELKGEYHKEIQTLDYDYHISEEDESGEFELVNQEVGELDMSGQQFGSEDVFIEIPNQSSSVEGVLNLEPDPFMKRLPHRHNRAIPNSVQEALADPRWKAAMNEEMKSLQKNETWELVECPPGKTRLVAKGYTQTYGIDYTETFAPVAKINTVRDAWCQKTMSEGVQIEEVIVWVEAIPESMETGMSGCQPVNTPIEEGLKLCVEPNQVSTDKGRYQRLVGILMYLAHTRPDLAYALSVKYIDADWADAVDDRRSTSGYFTFVGGNLVTWKSKKQNVVARSSAAEFRGNQSDCFVTIKPRVTLLIIQYNMIRTKHVEVDRFFIKEKLDDKIVELPKIRSEDQLADILTKAVSSQVFSKFLDKLGMCDIYAPT